MAVNIVSLEEARAKREPHVAGEAYCMACDHRWTGVWPMGVTELECPNCKSMKGRSTFEIAPQADALVYECACGNQLYHILSDRIHCPNCGQQTSYESLANSF
jgi:DNA-directed RNA polymerase subunit RPC12/RpoP